MKSRASLATESKAFLNKGLKVIVNGACEKKEFQYPNGIQDYIENVYNTWDIPPEFVTIVGDASGSYEVATNYEYYSGVYGEGDWPYSLLEGDDFLPEIIICRLSVRTPTHLGVVVNKILNYEKAVDMSEDWYETAALIGDPSDSGISTVITNEYIEQILENHGMENINTKYIFRPTDSTL